jgi:hypothetical protein
MTPQKAQSLLNLVLNDFLEPHRDVADVAPTNDDIIAAFDYALELIEQKVSQ